MFTRVIATTIQYNEEAVKMLEVALKSFYLFNSNFDFKVYCLDNSKELFENEFKKFNFENLEFINFKDRTKWNSFLERVKRNDLTDIERLNLFKNVDEYYVFDTSVCISKLEIVDLLLEKYDIVIMSDIDLVYLNSIEDCVNAFLESDQFIGACTEVDDYFNAGFMLFNKAHKTQNTQLFNQSINLLKNKDLRTEKKMYTVYGRFFACFEQCLLNVLTKDYFEINEYVSNISNPVKDQIKYFEQLNNKCLMHFSGVSYKPCHEITDKHIPYIKNIVVPLRKFYENLFNVFDVKINFKKSKYDQLAITNFRLYKAVGEKLRFIKRILNEKSKNRV